MPTKNSIAAEESLEQEEFALELFESVLTPSSSASQDLYDSIPWSSYSRYESSVSVENRPFRFGNNVITAQIIGAQYLENGKTKSVFPGPREELVESAVRVLMVRKISEKTTKLQVDSEHSQRYSLVAYISLKEIYDELCESGHTFNRKEIADALDVLMRTQVILQAERGDMKVLKGAHSILHHDFAQKSSRRRGDKVIFQFTFHPLIAEAIPKLDYRRYNYALNAKLDSIIARYLHRKMSRRYIQAHQTQPYVFALSGLVKDSAPLPKTTLPRQRDSIVQALDQLENAGVLSEPLIISHEESIPDAIMPPPGKGYHYEEQYVRRGRGRPKLGDVKFYLFPSSDYVDEVVRTNQDIACIKNRLPEANRVGDR